MWTRILTLLMVFLVSRGEGWSKPTGDERPIATDNPSRYHHLVGRSAIPGLFAGCSLAELGEPVYWPNKPERVFLAQIYLTPSQLSVYGVRYRLNVRISFDHDTLVGFPQLSNNWENYIESISRFESHPAVQRFLQVIEPDDMNYNGTQFYSDMFNDNRMSYYLDSASFYFLKFNQPELIRSIRLFLPKLDSLAWFNEFDVKVGIGRMLFDGGKVRISQSQICGGCINNVLFDYSESHFVKIALSANQSWESFPFIKYVQQVVDDHLKGDSIGSCNIGLDRGQIYMSRMSAHGRESWAVRVAVKCPERPALRDVCFRILPDSTIDRFYERSNN